MHAAMEDIKPSPASTDSDMGLGYKRSGESLLSSSSKRSAHDMYKVIEVPRLPTDLDLPPLPVIANKAVEMRVFTHSTMAPGNKSGVKYAEEEEDLQDNEKLEWVGDGLLSESVLSRLSSW
jgi:dsRNA-specific ribonuclease